MAKWCPEKTDAFIDELIGKSDISVCITLGDGNIFGIDNEDNMFIGRDSEPGSRIYLGKATVQNFNNLKGLMNRLQIHMHHESREER